MTNNLLIIAHGGYDMQLQRYAGLLIIGGKKCKIMRHFQCKLCSKKSLNMQRIMQFLLRAFHIVLPGFRRGESLLFNRQLECKGELKHIQVIYLIKYITIK